MVRTQRGCHGWRQKSAAGEHSTRPCQAKAASSHPLCLSLSLGCQAGAGMVRKEPLRTWAACQGLALGWPEL